MLSRTRTLIVMRHAKAEQFAASDFERSLTPRGRRDAEDAGLYLQAAGIHPQVALVSAAARTQETWQIVSAATTDGDTGATQEWVDRSLYHADTDDVLDLLRLQSDSVRSVIVVGHNPTMEWLAVRLSASESTPAAEQMRAGFPTSGVGVFAVPASWAELDWGSARADHFHVGRG